MSGGRSGAARRPARRTIAGFAVAVAGVALVAGCSLPQDDQPRAIARDELPKSLLESPGTTTAPPLGVRATPRTVYLVRTQDATDSLVPEVVSIEDPNDPADLPKTVLERLVNTPAPPDGSDLTTAIPAGVRVLSVARHDDVLDLDLSNLGNIESTRQRLAVAQLVFTATALEGVQGVRFAIDGTPTAVPVDAGTAEAGRVITRADFPNLNEPAAPTATTPPASPGTTAAAG